MRLRLIEITLPLAVSGCAGWLSTRGWREAAGIMTVSVVIWCVAGAFRVGVVEAIALVACSLFLAYPCGRIAGRLREIR